jgi:hypothetical protein
LKKSELRQLIREEISKVIKEGVKQNRPFKSFLKESQSNVTFTVDDEKLDMLLHDFHSRELDYKDDKGDSLYVLPKRDFDRFIDAADSRGFDVDYENSEDSVIYVIA